MGTTRPPVIAMLCFPGWPPAPGLPGA
jgi:hypothetical protein